MMMMMVMMMMSKMKMKMKMKMKVKVKMKMSSKYCILSMKLEGAVSSWLQCLTSHRAVHVGAIAGRGHCVVFLGKTFLLLSSVSLHPIVSMCTGEFNAEGNVELDLNPIQRGAEIPLVKVAFMLQKPG